jgi:CheY-like chemotaxis protein
MVQPMVDRRTHERGRVAAIAIVWSDERGPSRYLVEDMSAGGALLSGGPELPVGRKVGLSLHVAGEHLLDLQAEVVRDCGPRGLAIAFRAMTPAGEDTIQQTVLAALEAYRRGDCPARHVLVVDESELVCKSLQRDLTALGHRVVCAWTPEQIAARIHDPYVRYDIAVIDQSLGSTEGLELLREVAGLHPGVHRVLMSGSVSQSKLAQIMGKADGILPKPWSRRALLAVLPL